MTKSENKSKAEKAFKEWFEEIYGTINKNNAETAHRAGEAYYQGWIHGVEATKVILKEEGLI